MISNQGVGWLQASPNYCTATKLVSLEIKKNSAFKWFEMNFLNSSDILKNNNQTEHIVLES